MSPVKRLDAAATVRNLAGPVLRLAYDIEVWGTHHLPTHGSVLIVGDQPELLAGPCIKAVAPRPVHVIATDAAMQAVPVAAMAAAGDIACPEPGIAASDRALALLAKGGAVVLLGPTPAAGYLAASSGAPVAPVVVIGARGRVPTDPPALRSRIEVRFGAPEAIEAHGDPLAMATIRAAGERIRQRLADARAEAWARHGGEAAADHTVERESPR